MKVITDTSVKQVMRNSAVFSLSVLFVREPAAHVLELDSFNILYFAQSGVVVLLCEL